MILWRILICCLLCIAIPSAAEESTQQNIVVSKQATFGGGCFWCLQPVFSHRKGVISTSVGFMGGQHENPTYDEVCSGETGHVEVVQVIYDPKQTSYQELLTIYWKHVDFTPNSGAINGRNSQYRSVLFPHDQEQFLIAQLSKNKVREKYPSLTVITSIEPASTYFRAKERHQHYYAKAAKTQAKTKP